MASSTVHAMWAGSYKTLVCLIFKYTKKSVKRNPTDAGMAYWSKSAQKGAQHMHASSQASLHQWLHHVGFLTNLLHVYDPLHQEMTEVSQPLLDIITHLNKLVFYYGVGDQ